MTKTMGYAEAIVLIVAALIGNAPAQVQSGPPQGSFLEVDGAKLYYEECGSAPHAVVLVHDGVLHSAAWDRVWPDFCKHFHTIRYDRRGYGRSPAATHGYYATDDLVAVLRHRKLKHAAIVASSHGGEISINFTLDHPEMVEQLVLVGAVVGGMPYTRHFLERGDALGKPLEKGDIEGAIAGAVKDIYLTAPGSEAAKKLELCDVGDFVNAFAYVKLKKRPSQNTGRDSAVAAESPGAVIEPTNVISSVGNASAIGGEVNKDVWKKEL